MEPIIDISHLSKTYGDKVAVRDVSLTVQRGEIFGILGPNGAGKTTTVECLAGLRQADGGTIEVLGTDPQRNPRAVRGRLGIQLQQSQLPPKLRVSEALDLYAAFYENPADPAELLDLLGLHDKRDAAFEALSGGQQQRLSIALALVGNPEVAVLDELATGLDPQARRDTWALVEQVRDSGVTIVLVTHFMDEAERLCDRLAIIDGGTVVAEGPPDDLMRGADDRRALRLQLPDTAPEFVLATLEGLSEVTSVVADRGGYEVAGTARVLPAVVRALDDHGVVPEELRTRSHSLEDVFVRVTGHSDLEEAR